MKKEKSNAVKETLKEFHQLDDETIKDWRECLNEELMESLGFSIEDTAVLDLIASNIWKATRIPPGVEAEDKAEYDSLPSEEKEFWFRFARFENRDLDKYKDRQLLEEMAFDRWYSYTKDNMEVL